MNCNIYIVYFDLWQLELPCICLPPNLFSLPIFGGFIDYAEVFKVKQQHLIWLIFWPFSNWFKILFDCNSKLWLSFRKEILVLICMLLSVSPYYLKIVVCQEVLVRFAGFGSEEDEWVNIRRNIRPRSLPCESSECVAVLPGDLILCFQVKVKPGLCISFVEQSIQFISLPDLYVRHIIHDYLVKPLPSKRAWNGLWHSHWKI